MFGPDDHSKRECPLPIIRRHSVDSSGEAVVAEWCRAPVGVVRARSSMLLEGGGSADHEESWTNECANGHVLLVAEDLEEEDPIMFDQILVTRTLSRMAHFVHEQHRGNRIAS